MNISELYLTSNTYNKLEELGIETIEDVQRMFDGNDDRIKCLSAKQIREINKQLNYL